MIYTEELCAKFLDIQLGQKEVNRSLFPQQFYFVKCSCFLKTERHVDGLAAEKMTLEWRRFFQRKGSCISFQSWRKIEVISTMSHEAVLVQLEARQPNQFTHQRKWIKRDLVNQVNKMIMTT